MKNTESKVLYNIVNKILDINTVGTRREMRESFIHLNLCSNYKN